MYDIEKCKKKPHTCCSWRYSWRRWRLYSPDRRHLDVLEKDDKLFVCGDFGYVWDDSFRERKFLEYMANELKFMILFVDGNHENHRLLGDYPEEEWCGGKVHIIARDKDGIPKIIHLDSVK